MLDRAMRPEVEHQKKLAKGNAEQREGSSSSIQGRKLSHCDPQITISHTNDNSAGMVTAFLSNSH